MDLNIITRLPDAHGQATLFSRSTYFHRTPPSDTITLRQWEKERKLGPLHNLILSRWKQSHCDPHEIPSHKIAPLSDSIQAREDPCFCRPFPQITQPKLYSYPGCFLTFSYWNTPSPTQFSVVCFLPCERRNKFPSFNLGCILVGHGWRALTSLIVKPQLHHWKPEYLRVSLLIILPHPTQCPWSSCR